MSESRITEEVRDVVQNELRNEFRVDLESIQPADAFEDYIEANPKGSKEATLSSHRSRLKPFIRFCDNESITDLNDLTGRNIVNYTTKLDNSDRADTTIVTHLNTLTVFLRYCVRIEAVHPDIPEKIEIPKLEDGEDVRDAHVSAERMEQIRAYLDKYEYASTMHVLVVLMSEFGLRISAIRALDCGDFQPEEDTPYLTLESRPDTDTRLKNGERSERWVAVTDYTAELLHDYISERRPDVTGQYGRKPLIATDAGRISGSTIRKYLYMVTRPCVVGDCPHGRTQSDCDAFNSNDQAYSCPSSESPHSIRRGYITHELNNDVPAHVLSGRCDVTEEVMGKHYDTRSSSEKMKQRQRLFEKTHRNKSPYGK
ncbi:tyrosine-type recombinase/integrase [Halorubrum trapanicum]|uniref:tyrosine-type recombinase/integrase n=1 Tax=Halorubrum trapanicum TaxID=29284 RepID=UPI003C6F4D07